MDAPAVKVGDSAVHVTRYAHGDIGRVIRVGRIMRETKTQWIDDIGARWRKSDGAMVPQYGPEPRYLMSAEEYERLTGKGAS